MANVKELLAKVESANLKYSQTLQRTDYLDLLHCTQDLYEAVLLLRSKHVESTAETAPITPGLNIAMQLPNPSSALPEKPEVQASVTIKNPDVRDLTQMHHKESLNEKLFKPKEELADKLEAMPIADLRSAIGMNERFRLIEELFEKNTDQYNRVINDLNSMPGLKEAKDYFATRLQTLSPFSKHPEAAAQLMDLVERRFSK